MDIPATSKPRHAYAHRKAGASSPSAVYDAVRLYGGGNPRSTGATGGEWRTVRRKNTSRFTYAGR